jgi:hypothetical protein
VIVPIKYEHYVYHANQQGSYQRLERMIKNNIKIIPCGRAGSTRVEHGALLIVTPSVLPRVTTHQSMS